MDTWRAITELDLEGVLDSAELEQFRNRAASVAGVDPVAGLIANVVEEARGRIRANRDNRMGPDATLPGALIGRALVIVRHRVQTAVRIPIPEHRKSEYEQAEQFFRDVAKGLIAIDQPAEESAETRPKKALPRYNASSRPNTAGI